MMLILKKSLSVLCSYVVFGLCLLVLCGWQFEIMPFTRIFPEAPATTPITAFLLIFLAVCLRLAPIADQPTLRYTGMSLSILVFLFSAWLLLKYVLNLPETSELLFYKEILTAEYSSFPGRPSPHTLITSMMLACVLFVSFLKVSWMRRFLNVAGFISWILPWLAFFGYFTHNNAFYQLREAPDTGMSPITSFCFLLICIGALGLDQSKGLIYLMRSPSLGGKMIRVLLPFSLLGPLAFGWLISYGRLTGIFSGHAFISVDWGLASLVFMALVVIAGYLISDRDYQLFHAEMRYQRLVEDVEDYAILMLDTQGTIISWNKGAQQIKGYEEQEILGKNFSCFYTLDDQLQKKPEQLLERTRANGRARDSGWRVKKDGSQFWAEVIISLRYDIREGFIGFTKVTRDLTLQKKYLNTIETSEKRFRQFLESTPDAIVIVNREAKIVFANLQTQQLFENSSAELIESTVDQIIPKFIDKTREGISLSAESIRQWSEQEELVGQTKSGKTFPIELSLNTIETFEESLISISIRDVSASREAKKKIEELNKNLKIRAEEVLASNKELEAFSYSVSHDLRAPLRGIAGFSNKLIKNHSDHLDSEGKRVVNVIVQNVKRMGELIDNILLFSRLNRTHISYSPLNLTSMFQEAYQNLLPTEAPGRVIDFILDELPEIKGDRVTVMQVITNLISNALKYTRPRIKATIHVGKLVNRCETVIFIKDNGVGFDKRYTDKIFEVFQRLHSESEFEGTGIGLAIVQRIIQRHGGKVWAESILDEGTTFYIQLPIDENETP